MTTAREHRAPKIGTRTTKQRTAVAQLLRELDNFSSAKEIYHELDKRNIHVGLTTVYRTLQALADVHAVDVLRMANGETLYRHCHTESHHHHLVCTECGKTIEIDGGPVERWAKEVAKDHHFLLTGHDAEIYGVCAECA